MTDHSICDREVYKLESEVERLRAEATNLANLLATVTAERNAAEKEVKRLAADAELWRQKFWAQVAETRKLAELSAMLDEHPEAYDGPCWCAACMSYGSDDGEE